MIARNGEVTVSPKGSYSFPYGAAAMTRRLAEISHTKDPESERSALAATMKEEFEQAYQHLDLPQSLQNQAKRYGLKLYLSGGGFRGWGYLLMREHKNSPYPVPIINGFQVSKREFENIVNVQEVAATQDVFRVSKRRAEQVPAVAFLVETLVEALPMIEEIRFCQGGVREGYLYGMLDAQTKAMDPLVAATAKYANPSSAEIAELLNRALPGENSLGRFLPSTFRAPLIRALADMMFVHSSLSKESRSLAALYTPITGGLASAHGVSHVDRTLLALMLCRRWDGDLAPPHDQQHSRLQHLLTAQEVFWSHYLGSVAELIGHVYPAGQVVQPRVQFDAAWAEGLGKKGLEQGVTLMIHVRQHDAMTAPDVLREAIKKVEGLGKKKNRIGGRDGFGVPIEVSVERDLP